MRDAEFVFMEDIYDKKKTGRGVYHKVRGGGKYVKMPSDNLSRNWSGKSWDECLNKCELDIDAWCAVEVDNG